MTECDAIIIGPGPGGIPLAANLADALELGPAAIVDAIEGGVYGQPAVAEAPPVRSRQLEGCYA